MQLKFPTEFVEMCRYDPWKRIQLRFFLVVLRFIAGRPNAQAGAMLLDDELTKLANRIE